MSVFSFTHTMQGIYTCPAFSVVLLFLGSERNDYKDAFKRFCGKLITK